MLSAIDPHFTKTFELKQHHSSLRETALDSLITSTLLPMGCSSRPCPSWSSHAPCERSSATRTWPRSCVVEIVRSAISPVRVLFAPLRRAQRPQRPHNRAGNPQPLLAGLGRAPRLNSNTGGRCIFILPVGRRIPNRRRADVLAYFSSCMQHAVGNSSAVYRDISTAN